MVCCEWEKERMDKRRASTKPARRKLHYIARLSDLRERHHLAIVPRGEQRQREEVGAVREKMDRPIRE